MRMIVMGTGPFAVPSCRRLQAEGHEIIEVIVRPPANSKAPPAPVATWAESCGLPIYRPTSINLPETLEHLQRHAPDLFFVCDYGQILSQACLKIPSLGGINLHGSLLPRHRGAAPVQWTLLSGDQQAGVSVIHMTPGLDAGPVLTERASAIQADEDAEQLEGRLAELGADASCEAVQRLSQWDRVTAIGRVQDKLQATKAPRLAKSDGLLNFTSTAEQLECRVRGLQPWPGAYGQLSFSASKQMQIHVRSARALPQLTSDKPVGAAWSATASSLGLQGDRWSAPWDQLIVIQTASGVLVASKVQPAGKRVMAAAEFLRGHPLTPQAVFTASTTTNASG